MSEINIHDGMNSTVEVYTAETEGATPCIVRDVKPGATLVFKLDEAVPYEAERRVHIVTEDDCQYRMAVIPHGVSLHAVINPADE